MKCRICGGQPVIAVTGSRCFPCWDEYVKAGGSALTLQADEVAREHTLLQDQMEARLLTLTKEATS